MPLYPRLLGRDDAGNEVEGQIPVHAFQAVMAERARGRIASDAVARDVLNSVLAARGKSPLTTSEGTEAQQLLATITGTATAKLARAKEIDDVLLLAQAGATGYAEPSQVKTRLGV